MTSDGYCCLAADKNNDINLIGGLSSLTDYSNGRYDPEICLVREFLEETGADIRGEHFSYSLKYIKTPDEDETYSPVGLIYEVRTTYGKDDIENIMPPSLARAIASVSFDTDCIIAEAIGMLRQIGHSSSPFLNLTSGVLRLTFAGMHSFEV